MFLSKWVVLKVVSVDNVRTDMQVLFVFCLLGPQHPLFMEVPRLWVKLELLPLAYATAMPALSSVCDLHHSSQQCRILNPMNEARNRTCILMEASQIHFCWAMTGIPRRCLHPDFRLGPMGERGQHPGRIETPIFPLLLASTRSLLTLVSKDRTVSMGRSRKCRLGSRHTILCAVATLESGRFSGSP